MHPIRCGDIITNMYAHEILLLNSCVGTFLENHKAALPSIQCRVIISPPAKHHLNGVLLQADGGSLCLLGIGFLGSPLCCDNKNDVAKT